jgi:hypothetical protein
MTETNEAGRFIVNNTYKVNGWQLTGYQWTRSRIAIKVPNPLNSEQRITLTTESIRPKAWSLSDYELYEDLKAKGARVVEERTITIRAGAIQLRESEDWEDFNEWNHQQHGYGGIQICIKFG